MGLRIEREFDSAYDNVRYKVKIYDTDFVSTTITTIGLNGVKITWDGEFDKIQEPLCPSTCEVTLLNDGSADFNAFYNDLKTAQENEHRLVIDKWDGFTYNTFWVGVIMTDLAEMPNQYASVTTPIDFTLRATDGLTRAANIEFSLINSSPYVSGGITYPQTFLKVIFDCLSYNETAAFFNNDYLRISTAWKDVVMDLTNADPTRYQQRSLELIRIDRDFFFDKEFDDHGQGWTKNELWKWINEYGNPHTRLRSVDDPALKVRTTLREILQILGLCIKQSNGTWYIYNKSLMTNSSLYYARYNTSGTYTGRISENLRVSLSTLAGGRFGSLPALKSAKATVYPSDVLNLVSSETTRLTGTTVSHTETLQLGTLYGGTGLRLILEYSWQTIAWLNSYDVIVTMQIVANDGTDDWAFKHNHDKTGITQGTWTNTPSDYCRIALGSVGLNDGYTGKVNTNVFETPDLPFTDPCEDATIIITTTVSNSPTTIGSSALDILPFKIRLVTSEGNIGVISDYVSYNPDLTIGNSTDIEFGNLRIFDTGIISSKNSIQVDEYIGAGRWTKSTNWDAGFDNDESLVKTILKEAVAFQRKPVDKYTGQFAGEYNPHQVLSFDSDYWVFMSGTLNLYHDSIDGVWFKILHEPNGVEPPSTNKGTEKGPGFGALGFPLSDTRSYNFRTPGSDNTFFPIAKTNLSDRIPITGGPYTQLDIDALIFQHLKSSDNLFLIHHNTRDIIGQVQLTADTNVSDATLDILSFTPSVDLGEGTEIALNANELFITNEMRAVGNTELGYGDSTAQEYILKARTINTTTTELTTDGATGLGTANRIQIPTNSACLVELLFSVKQDSSANCGKLKRELLISNNGGTVALNGSVQTIGTDIITVAIAAITVTASANNTNDALKVEVNGIGATFLNWTCLVRMTISRY